jgi:transcriptional regulator with XRE-family HTH domain
MTITPAQCRMARAAVDMGVRQLAAAAGVSAMTVTRFENGRSRGYDDTREKLQRALESAGVEFTNGDQPGVRMKKSGG